MLIFMLFVKMGIDADAKSKAIGNCHWHMDINNLGNHFESSTNSLDSVIHSLNVAGEFLVFPIGFKNYH